MKQIYKLLLVLLFAAISVPGDATIFERAFKELDYENYDWGVNIDYVNRQFRLNSGGTSSYYNSWGDAGKMEHGFQIGMTYQPYFGYGQGMLTGLSFRMLMGIRDFGGDYLWYEPQLYIPLMYRFILPVLDDMAVYLQAGFGMEIGLGRLVSVDNNDDYYYYDDYGYDDSNDINMGYDSGNPKCVQFSIPVGIGFTYQHFEVGVRYSLGLTNNASNFDIVGDNTGFKQRMWQAGISILF